MISVKSRRISPRYHLWNPPKIIKASVSAKTLQFDECRVGDFTLKSGGFQLWNLVDFTQISPVKSTQSYKSKCFSKNSSVWWMQGGGFHPWNPVDFTWKMVDFTCEIWWISPRFHLWNPPKIIKASVSAKLFSLMNAGWGLWPRISWNPPDFTMRNGGFHPWNLADFTQISLVKSTQNLKSNCFSKTLQFDECRVGISPLKSNGISPWNLVEFHPWNLADFTQIWPVKSTQNYKSKCFIKTLLVWWMQGGGISP